MRYSFELVPEHVSYMPMMPPPVTVQLPADAQMSVTPFVMEKGMFALHAYEPVANVSVAPSVA